MTEHFEFLENTTTPKAIAKMAIPTIFSQIVTLLYNLADTFFVGHTNDSVQIAAITLSFPLFMSLTMLGNLFGMGANSLISRSLGKCDKQTPVKASAIALWGALTLTLFWITFLFINRRSFLLIIGANPDTYDVTWSYLKWTVIIGGIPTVASLVLAHCIRGEGNTAQASVGVSIGGILNIVLDPIFVQLLGMGAQGAGIATCISNIVSLIYFIFVLIQSKDTIIKLNPLDIKFDLSILKEILLVGLPSATVVVLGATANMVLTHLMSSYGEVPLAAFGIVQKAGTVTIQITIGMTQGIVPLIGYYYGAGNNDKVREICRCAFVILGCFSFFSVLIAELFPRYIIMIFTTDEDIVSIGSWFLRIWILCAFGMCFVNLIGSIFQATRGWKKALALSIIRQAVLFIPLMIILNRYCGMFGLIISQPIADTIALLISFVIYYQSIKITRLA